MTIPSSKREIHEPTVSGYAKLEQIGVFWGRSEPTYVE